MGDDSLSRRAFVARTTAAGLAFGALGTASRVSGAPIADRREVEPVIVTGSRRGEGIGRALLAHVATEAARQASEVLLHTIYSEAFGYFRVGYAASLVAVFLVFILVLSAIRVFVLDRRRPAP